MLFNLTPLISNLIMATFPDINYSANSASVTLHMKPQ